MKAPMLLPFAFCLALTSARGPARTGARHAAQDSRQGPVERMCPTIAVECPESVGVPGVPVNFKAKISGAGPSPSLTLKWVVSEGTILPGQNDARVTTPDSITEVTVDTTGVPRFSAVTATAEVTGLDRSCSNSASCSTAVRGVIDTRPLDEYGEISFEDEQARLDNFAVKLQNSPEFSGYVICYGGRIGGRGEAAARCARARKYLVGRRNIEPSRVLTFDGGFREHLTVVLWILPPNVEPPISPTVDPSEVRFIEGPRRRKARSSRGRRPGV